MIDLEFFRGKKILVTGHTGFKGTWLCKILINAGAKVTGYSLKPFTKPNLFELSNIENYMDSIIGDIRDLQRLKDVFEKSQPEIVIHLAAQPIVRESYRNPVYTYETNLMGTVNILECIRNSQSVKSFLNVTTDKVYKNNEWQWGYRENECLEGFDPYSNSKSCSEIITSCFKNSFLAQKNIAVSTARAGNVLGGGDFSQDRIIPDCIRAIEENKDIIVRNPHSIRPYQHVLDAIAAYLIIVQKQFEDISFAGNYNIGPDEKDCIETGDLVDIFCSKWGKNIKWKNTYEANAPHEANFLKLDCSKMKYIFGWHPVWGIETSVEKVIEWTKIYLNSKKNIDRCMDNQIKEFFNYVEVSK